MSTISDCCASEVNVTTMPSLSSIIRPIFHAVNSCLSSIYSTSSSHFCAIVAVTEADFGQYHVPIGEFREFQECEAQNKVSRAKICIERGDAEAWMIVPYHLGGRLGGDVGSSVGLGNAVG